MPDVSRDNAPFLFQAEPDGVLVVNFGFTSCPDVCPTTLAEIRAALRDLGPLAEQVSVAMVTVDPDRDVPAVVTGYLQSFVADGHALRGDDSQLAAAAAAFDVLYEVTVSDDGSVDVGHTASVFVVDDRGFLRVTWPFGMPADDMASDLRILLATD
jgi:protein SCO1/2